MCDVPLWEAQPFFPVLGNLLIQHPLILANRSDILIYPLKEGIHPLVKKGKLKLLACRLSGKIYKDKDYMKRLQISSLQPGDLTHSNSMIHMLKDGNSYASQGRLNPPIQI